MSEESSDLDNQIREGNQRIRESREPCNHEETIIDTLWWKGDREVDR